MYQRIIIGLFVLLTATGVSAQSEPVITMRYGLPVGAVVQRVVLNQDGKRVMVVYRGNRKAVLQVNDSMVCEADDIMDCGFSRDGESIWYTYDAGGRQFVDRDGVRCELNVKSKQALYDSIWKYYDRSQRMLMFEGFRCYRCPLINPAKQSGTMTMDDDERMFRWNEKHAKIMRDTATGKYTIRFNDQTMGPYDYIENFYDRWQFLFGVKDTAAAASGTVLYQWHLRTMDSTYTGPVCANVPFVEDGDGYDYAFLYNIGGEQNDTTYDCNGGRWYVMTRDSVFGPYRSVRRDINVHLDILWGLFKPWIRFGTDIHGSRRYGFAVEEGNLTRLVTNTGTIELGPVDAMWQISFSPLGETCVLYETGYQGYIRVEGVLLGPYEWTMGPAHFILPAMNFTEDGLNKWFSYTTEGRWENQQMISGYQHLWLNGRVYGPWKAAKLPGVHVCEDGSSFIVALPVRVIEKVMRGNEYLRDRMDVEFIVDGRTDGPYPDDHLDCVVTVSGEVFLATAEDGQIVVSRLKEALP